MEMERKERYTLMEMLSFSLESLFCRKYQISGRTDRHTDRQTIGGTRKNFPSCLQYVNWTAHTYIHSMWCVVRLINKSKAIFPHLQTWACIKNVYLITAAVYTGVFGSTRKTKTGNMLYPKWFSGKYQFEALPLKLEFR